MNLSEYWLLMPWYMYYLIPTVCASPIFYLFRNGGEPLSTSYLAALLIVISVVNVIESANQYAREVQFADREM